MRIVMQHVRHVRLALHMASGDHPCSPLVDHAKLLIVHPPMPTKRLRLSGWMDCIVGGKTTELHTIHAEPCKPTSDRRMQAGLSQKHLTHNASQTSKCSSAASSSPCS